MCRIIKAWLGIYGVAVFMLACLGLIIVFLKKEKPKWAFGLGLLWIVGFPLWLDRICLYKWYELVPFPEESSRSAEEWMDFLGSYLGVAGTIVAGALAYWQTQVNRKQDADIERQKNVITQMQGQLAAYQILPAVLFQEGILQVYSGERNYYTNNMAYQRIHFRLCGKPFTGNISSFLYICINFQERGMIPVEKVSVMEIKWCVADETYIVNPSEEKCTLSGGTLEILVDQSARIVKRGNASLADAIQEFMDAMTVHKEYLAYGKADFDKSQLILSIELVNQMKKARKYMLDYRIEREYNEEEIILTNPHVSVMQE